MEQALGLLLHRLGGAGRGFDQPHVLLRRLVHRHDGLVDLIDPDRLLLRRRADLRDDVRHPLDGIHDVLQRLTRLIHQGAPVRDALDRLFDQPGDLLGRKGRALRQIADLRRHHGKAPSMFAGPRRFHRRVQRQKIRLERNLVDHGDDVGDLLAALVDFAHGRHGLVNHLGPLIGRLTGRDGQLVRLLRIVRVLFDGRRHFLHGGRGLLQGRRLFAGALRQVLVPLADRLRAGQDPSRYLMDGLDRVGQVRQGQIERPFHVLEFALIGPGHAGRQVVRRQGVEHPLGLAQRKRDGIDQPVDRLRQIAQIARKDIRFDALRQLSDRRRLDQLFHLDQRQSLLCNIRGKPDYLECPPHFVHHRVIAGLQPDLPTAFSKAFVLAGLMRALRQLLPEGAIVRRLTHGRLDEQTVRLPHEFIQLIPHHLQENGIGRQNIPFEVELDGAVGLIDRVQDPFHIMPRNLVLRDIVSDAQVFSGFPIRTHDGFDHRIDIVGGAVFCAVLHHSTEDLSPTDRAPQLLEDFFGHIGMAHNVVRLADQFVLRILGDFHEFVVDGNDLAF